MDNKKISLIGMMGSGKSLTGKRLAQNLKIKFIDLDDEIELHIGYKISKIFEKFGELFFRQKESEILCDIIKNNSSYVLSCGGGTILSKENQNILLKNSKIIWLTANASEISKRLEHDYQRPLLKKNNSVDAIQEVIDKREKFYNIAHHKISTDDKNVIEICDQIQILLNIK